MLMLDRRMLLRAGSAAAAAAALAPTAPALAHAPQAGKRAQPSFYRFKLGTIEITVVSDGTLAFPAETLWGDRAEDARGLLTSTFQPSSPVGLQINTVLVNTGDKLVLIDAGCGVDKYQKTTGGLLRNLAAAGYAPGDIDMILITHAHFDPLWGISDHENSSLMFPSAEVVVNSTVSFLHPEWPFGFDMDIEQATKARVAFLDRAATDRTLVGSYHLPFPGFGHVVREGSGYRWLPADWQWTS